MKVDLHTHILPDRWPDVAARHGCDGYIRLEHTGPGCGRLVRNGEVFREVRENLWSPSVRLADCDRDGVRVQVLSTVPVMFSYEAPPALARDLSRVLNDHIAGVVAARPDRFAGLGTVPLQDTELAVAELERCVRDLGLAGVEIGTHVAGKDLDDPALFPFFERAAALGAAVFVHPWDMLGRDRMCRHWLPWLVGMPAETALAAAALLFGGVLEKLPALRVALAHGGGAFPFLLGRMQHGYEVRPDLCATASTMGPLAQRRRLYVDSLVHDPHALRYLIATCGADRVALGSDYPFPLGESRPGELIESLALGDEVRAALLWRTALEFLGIPEDRFSEE